MVLRKEWGLVESMMAGLTLTVDKGTSPTPGGGTLSSKSTHCTVEVDSQEASPYQTNARAILAVDILRSITHACNSEENR